MQSPARIERFGNRHRRFRNSAAFLAEAEWKRTIIVPGGLAVTPLFALRGDSDLVDSAILPAREAFRGMATAGLDVRWPILFSTTSATHILEPVAQIFMRNNERFAGYCQTKMRRASCLMRQTCLSATSFRAGTAWKAARAPILALRYSGTFANGWTANALFGQSYHLAGLNSFASPDLVAAGAYSGLETDVSDYVAAAGFSSGTGLSLAARGRFDEKTFEVRRGEAELAYAGNPVSGSLALCLYSGPAKIWLQHRSPRGHRRGSVKFKRKLARIRVNDL